MDRHDCWPRIGHRSGADDGLDRRFGVFWAGPPRKSSQDHDSRAALGEIKCGDHFGGHSMSAQPLEARRLLAAALTGDVLQIRGTDEADEISLRLSGDTIVLT